MEDKTGDLKTLPEEAFLALIEEAKTSSKSLEVKVKQSTSNLETNCPSKFISDPRTSGLVIPSHEIPCIQTSQKTKKSKLSDNLKSNSNLPLTQSLKDLCIDFTKFKKSLESHWTLSLSSEESFEKVNLTCDIDDQKEEVNDQLNWPLLEPLSKPLQDHHFFHLIPKDFCGSKTCNTDNQIGEVNDLSKGRPFIPWPRPLPMQSLLNSESKEADTCDSKTCNTDNQIGEVNDLFKRRQIVPRPRPFSLQSFFNLESKEADTCDSKSDKQILTTDVSGNPFVRSSLQSPLSDFVTTSLLNYNNSNIDAETKNRENKRAKNSVVKGVLSESIEGYQGHDDIESLLEYSTDKKTESAVKGSKNQLLTSKKKRAKISVSKGVLSESIEGYRGHDDIESLLEYINSSDKKTESAVKGSKNHLLTSKINRLKDHGKKSKNKIKTSKKVNRSTETADNLEIEAEKLGFILVEKNDDESFSSLSAEENDDESFSLLSAEENDDESFSSLSAEELENVPINKETEAQTKRVNNSERDNSTERGISTENSEKERILF